MIMIHTYSKIWAHYIWSTKNREPLITDTLIAQLIAHFKEKYVKGGNICVDTANGVSDHFHLLVGQMPVMSASEVANQIKGESSHWVNSHNFIPQKFAWQNGFSVFSVSHSQVQAVRKYIFNQKEHHRNETYAEEIARFLKAHDIYFNKIILKN
jgi:REP element-mobilizing transposase RayT